MIEPQVESSLVVPVVGTARARGVALVRRTSITLAAAGVVTGFAAALEPWGMTLPWLTAVFAVTLLATFVIGLRLDLRSVGQLSVTSPERRLVLRGPWATGQHDVDEVVAVQVWCDCGGGRRMSVAPHRDELEVFLRDGRSVQMTSGTVFAPDVAMTLSELLAPAGVKVVDWGEIGAA